MKINDKNLKDLKIALTYFIKGIVAKKDSNEWIEDIQRITEHALLEYSVIDIRKKNFINLYEIKYNKKNIKIVFNNSNCKYKNIKHEITILIPFRCYINDNYELFGDVNILIT